MRLKEQHERSAIQNSYWRMIGLQKAVGILRNATERIDTFEKAVRYKDIGEPTALKIAEIAKSGSLRRISMMKQSDDKLRHHFQNIYGVGPKLAQSWIDLGARSLKDIDEEKYGVKTTKSQ